MTTIDGRAAQTPTTPPLPQEVQQIFSQLGIPLDAIVGATGTTPSGANARSGQPVLVAQTPPAMRSTTPQQLDPATVNQTHNVVRLRSIADPAVVGGMTVPGSSVFNRLPGVAGAPGVYLIGDRGNLNPSNNDFLDPTVFVGIPLDRHGVDFTTFASVVGMVLQGGGTSADAVTTVLFNRYQQVAQLLNRPEVRAALPQGVQIVPQIVATTPTGEIIDLFSGQGVDWEEAEIGIGFGIKIPDRNTLIFANSRVVLEQAQQAIQQGEMPVLRTYTIGAVALTQRGNYGVATGGLVESYDPQRPTAIQVGQGVWEAPEIVDTMLQLLNGRAVDLASLDGQMTQIAEIVNMDEETLRSTIQGVGTGVGVLDRLAQIGGIVAAFKMNPIAGGLATVFGLIEADAELAQWTTDQLVQSGEYDPAVSATRIGQTVADPEILVYQAYEISKAVDQAIEYGIADPEDLLMKWDAVAQEPWTVDDPAQAYRVMLANAVLGRHDDVEIIAEVLGAPLPNYGGVPGDGNSRGGTPPNEYLSMVGSVRLQETERPEFVYETAPDGTWRRSLLSLEADESGRLRYVAGKHDDPREFYELPPEVNGDREQAIAYVERSIAAGGMSDTDVVDASRRTIAAIVGTPQLDDGPNTERLLDLTTQWLANDPQADLVRASAELIRIWNDPGTDAQTKQNVSVLWGQPMLAPIRALYDTIFADMNESGDVMVPDEARGPEGLLDAGEIAAAMNALRGAPLTPQEFDERIEQAAEALHELRWPMNFGSPELDAALKALGPIEPSAAFREYQQYYR